MQGARTASGRYCKRFATGDNRAERAVNCVTGTLGRFADAANGADAINLLRAKGIKIDMMLLDMTIPGPSSREVAARAAEARPGLRVVLTSAYDEKLARTTVGATQACGFVRKPFQIDELVHSLRSALSAVQGTTG